MENSTMGTTSGGNGRLAPVISAGRPTCDEVYRVVAEKFLKKHRFDTEDDFAEAVARRFREGPARICCRSIGTWIDGKLTDFDWSQQDLADRVGVDRSAVARWTSGGSISLGHLVLVLIEFRSDFDELPFPARRELALEGYLAALTHVRGKIGAGFDAGPIDRERFWCLYHLFSEPHWERAIRSRNPKLLEDEAVRIGRQTEASLGHLPRAVHGVEGLKQLVEEWAAAWVICLNLVPRDWSIQ